jgi:flagellar biogenesis protein FliO
MLTPMFNRKQQRNSYFHFHPMHTTWSLLAVIVLVGLLAWFLSRIH